MARFRDWVFGQLVRAVDMLDMQEQTRNLAGWVGSAVAGTDAFLPSEDALQVTAGGGMSVNVGGANQYVFLPAPSGFGSRVAYSLGSQNVPINAADPSQARNDLICIKFNAQDTNSYNVSVRASDGSVSQQPVWQVDDTYSVQYVPGTPGGGDPTASIPAGYVAFARVTVPAGAASIVAGDITILFKTIAQIVQSTIGPFVSSLNSETGAVTLTSSDNTIDITPSAQTIDLKVDHSGLKTSVVRSIRFGAAGSQTIDITLPGVAGDTWALYATFDNDNPSGSTQSLSGTGATDAGSEWNGTQSYGGGGYKVMSLYGTAPGGTAISCTASCGGHNGTWWGRFTVIALKQ